MVEAQAMRLTDRVKQDLVQLIDRTNLKIGDKLPTADRLCEQFSVSRTVVREAIAGLKADGRLRSLRGSGVYVSEPARAGGSMFMEAPQDIGDVLDFIEFRMSVEIEAAGLAAERRTETNLLRMEQAMSQFARHLQDNSLATDADRAFHRAVADATNNARFRLFVDEMGERLIPRRALGASFADQQDKAEFLDNIQREHRRIFEAINERQADAARAAMRQHLEGGRRRYREWSLLHDTPHG
ncbi:FadR/GntR family transcriptional regulator [uncultured Devosia sp.]|uniref:FadR/GntR family transcriptional regulator n=1 Tax=uncultured Devosia sp. TaxID=211434 RepID=UPI0035CAC8FC